MIFTEIFPQEDVSTNVQKKNKLTLTTFRDFVSKSAALSLRFMEKTKRTNVCRNVLMDLMLTMLLDCVSLCVLSIQTLTEIHQTTLVLKDVLQILISTQIP
jgi:hypothetical protein